MIFDFKELYKDLIANDFEEWQETLPTQLKEILDKRPHGKTAEWKEILATLPEIIPSQVNITIDKLQIGLTSDCEDEDKEKLHKTLQRLHPWRKGPYELFGIHIDTEWHSDWKWQRIQPHISPLKNRSVLDVGCGNGYYMWRMLGEGARLVVGADPSQFFLVQFNAIKKYVSALNGEQAIHIVPLKGEELPAFTQEYKGKGFDTVFSMGVLYHRLSPIDHLKELRNFIRKEGELVLETLVIEGDDSNVLIPEDRYAKMRNVWFIPTPDLLVRMLERAGFKNIRVVDINQTNIEEQRSTKWMEFESLEDFLDPDDHNKTIEGYPAPRRIVVIATA